MASHLTLEEREVIARMKAQRRSQAQIARRLGRAESTISRELQRNHSSSGYWAVAAQKKAERRRRCRRRIRKMQRPEVRRYVQERLRQSWSPDQIAARSRKDFPRDPRRQISHQTIYAWIESEDAKGRNWRRFLRSAGWKRRNRDNRGRIPAAISIAGRPAVVDRRSRFGDWEGDTIVGAYRRGGAVTLVERKSGYLLMGRADNLRAATVREATTELYRSTRPALRKTLTLDNGKEFTEHQLLAADSNLKVYFAEPRCPWQRGCNEHANGLIRQFFPKGTDLAKLPQHRLTQVQQLLNDRPRKRLGYRTPAEVLGPRLLLAIDT